MDRVAGGHINRDLGQENCVRLGDNNFNLRETKVRSNQNASISSWNRRKFILALTEIDTKSMVRTRQLEFGLVVLADSLSFSPSELAVHKTV